MRSKESITAAQCDNKSIHKQPHNTQQKAATQPKRTAQVAGALARLEPREAQHRRRVALVLQQALALPRQHAAELHRQPHDARAVLGDVDAGEAREAQVDAVGELFVVFVCVLCVCVGSCVCVCACALF